MIEIGRMGGELKFEIQVFGIGDGYLIDSKDKLMGLFDIDESEEDEDDLLQRTGNFISTSTSLPKGILKVRISKIGPNQLITSNPKYFDFQTYGFLLSVGLNVLAVFLP